jgi:hypothetical protein
VTIVGAEGWKSELNPAIENRAELDGQKVTDNIRRRVNIEKKKIRRLENGI